jgi:hypothetical protein
MQILQSCIHGRSGCGTLRRKLRFTLLLASLFALLLTVPLVQAADDGRSRIWDTAEFTYGDQFSINVPAVNLQELLLNLKETRYSLELHRKQLQQQLADAEITGGKVALAAVMPGGLLYLAIKKQQYEDYRKQLADLQGWIVELEQDLPNIASLASRIMVAHLP